MSFQASADVPRGDLAVAAPMASSDSAAGDRRRLAAEALRAAQELISVKGLIDLRGQADIPPAVRMAVTAAACLITGIDDADEAPRADVIPYTWEAAMVALQKPGHFVNALRRFLHVVDLGRLPETNVMAAKEIVSSVSADSLESEAVAKHLFTWLAAALDYYEVCRLPGQSTGLTRPPPDVSVPFGDAPGGPPPAAAGAVASPAAALLAPRGSQRSAVGARPGSPGSAPATSSPGAGPRTAATNRVGGAGAGVAVGSSRPGGYPGVRAAALGSSRSSQGAAAVAGSPPQRSSQAAAIGAGSPPQRSSQGAPPRPGARRAAPGVSAPQASSQRSAPLLASAPQAPTAVLAVQHGAGGGSQPGQPPRRESPPAAGTAAAAKPLDLPGTATRQPMGISGGFPRGTAGLKAADLRAQIEQLQREKREMQVMEAQMKAKMRREEETQKLAEARVDRKEFLDATKEAAVTMKEYVEQQQKLVKQEDSAKTRDFQEAKRIFKEVDRQKEVEEIREQYVESKENSQHRVNAVMAQSANEQRVLVENHLEKYHFVAQYDAEERLREQQAMVEKRELAQRAELELKLQQARQERMLAVESVEFVRGIVRDAVPMNKHLPARVH